jgi:hypothetical protein
LRIPARSIPNVLQKNGPRERYMCGLEKEDEWPTRATPNLLRSCWQWLSPCQVDFGSVVKCAVRIGCDLNLSNEKKDIAGSD